MAAGLHVTALHVDHGLRPGSAREADLVKTTSEHLGASFRALTVHLPEGPNLEARARAARYTALPPGVLTGHTAEDQAETVLLNLLRGAGASGMAAMRPGPQRPLLGLRRHETVGLCEQMGLDLVHDPSNNDPRHLRNRVRHELLPLMDTLARRDLVPVLTRQAGVARDEADLLDELAAAIDPTDARVLAASPPALARRAVRLWLSGEHPPDLATVERVLAVARGDAVGTDIGGGFRVTRHRQKLVRSSPTEPPVERVT